jgi:lysophospholipase L1-like esterase
MPTIEPVADMDTVSRRDFLRGLAASAFLFSLNGGAASRTVAGEAAPFDLLVIGDSLIWGQGLEEKDKFYTLIAEWLRRDAFASPRAVDLRVKAHSGSTLKLHADTADKFIQAKRPENSGFDPEVNVGFPSSWKQIENADAEYRSEGKNGADLIMICGGITDITTSRVFDPRGNDDELRAEIKKYCRDDMLDVLELAAGRNPKAKLAVIGYFPVITTSSINDKMLNAWLEALSFPRAFKVFVNNPVVRPMFFNKLKVRGIERSRIWLAESNRNLLEAVETLNARLKTKRAVFVPSPLGDENAVESPKSMLFRMGKNGVVSDPAARRRIKACRKSLPDLKRSTNVEYPVRLCEIAAIGHPNAAGARAYSEAIKAAIAPLLG